MNKSYTSVCCILLVLALFSLVCIPVYASESVIGQTNLEDLSQDRVDTINELIRQIRKAKLAGDTETADSLESILAKLDVEHVEGQNIVSYLDHAGIDLFVPEHSINAELPVVSDTATVDWYIADYKGYYYPRDSHYYDVYMIIATPKNSASMLQESNRVMSNDSFSVFFENANEIVADDLITHVVDFVDDNLSFPLFSILDAVVYLFDGTAPQTVETVSAKAWTMQTSSYSTFTYIYIRNADTAHDYELAMCGSEIELNYGYVQEISATNGDGIERSKITPFAQNGIIYSDSTYADIGVAIDYFKMNTYKNNIIYYIDVDIFTVDGVVTDTARIPVPDWVSDPTRIQSESEQGGAVQ